MKIQTQLKRKLKVNQCKRNKDILYFDYFHILEFCISYFMENIRKNAQKVLFGKLIRFLKKHNLSTKCRLLTVSFKVAISLIWCPGLV